MMGNHIHFGPSKVAPSKGSGPPTWGNRFSEVNTARRVKSNAQVAMNKNPDLVQKLLPHRVTGEDSGEI